MAYGLGHQGFRPFMGISTIPLNPFTPNPMPQVLLFQDLGLVVGRETWGGLRLNKPAL